LPSPEFLSSGSVKITRGDEVAGLDRQRTELVSIALVHAARFTEPTSDAVVGDQPKRITAPLLAAGRRFDWGLPVRIVDLMYRHEGVMSASQGLTTN